MAVFGIPRLARGRRPPGGPGRRRRCATRSGGAERRAGAATGASTLGIRTGVNTGEVVAGRPGQRASAWSPGDAVNIAARLEQAAEPGEILIGEPTFRLVRDAVDRRAASSRSRQGQGRTGSGLPAGRGATPEAEAHARRLDSPMVGPGPRAAPLRARPGSTRSRADRATCSPCSGRPGSGSPAWSSSSSRAVGRCHGRCAGGASPTARASRSGPWRRWSGQAAGIVDERRSPTRSGGRSSTVVGRGRRRTVDRRWPSCSGLAGRRRSGAEDVFWAVRELLRGPGPGPPAGDRVRRHPLGRAARSST